MSDATLRDVRVELAPIARQRQRGTFWVVVLAWTLGSLSVVALWLLAFGLLFSGWNEEGAQRRLYAQAREELAAQTGPIGEKKIPVGAPLAVFDIPRLDLDDLVVVEGTSGSALRAGPGHRRDTPLPGQPGSSVVMGRSLLFGAPFEHLTDLRRGDRIDVETGQGKFRYVVDGIRRAGDAVPTLESGRSRLTLVTASSRTGLTGKREVVSVDAHLKGTPQPSQGAVPDGIDANEVPMAGDRGAIVLVVFYLQLLLGVVVAVSWAAARWRPWPSLIVGVPLVVAALWLVSDTAVLLLPNLS